MRLLCGNGPAAAGENISNQSLAVPRHRQHRNAVEMATDHSAAKRHRRAGGECLRLDPIGRVMIEARPTAAYQSDRAA
jgi:hypothetical protein